MNLDLQKQWSKNPKLIASLSILWLLLISWLAFFWNVGNISIIDETEPLFAEASRQMVATGDWITPYYNGVTRFDKPILIYWLQALAFSIFGVNEWAVRLPSTLSAFGLTCLGFYTLRYFGVNPFQNSSRKLSNSLRQQELWYSAFIGASLIALNPLTIAWGRTGVSDSLLTACIGGGLMSFFIAYATNQHKTIWYIAFYILIGLAALTKGPVGIVLPAAIALIFLFYVGNLKPVFREMKLLWGIFIILLINVPWYALAIWRNGESFINSFFGYHNVERFTTVVNHHAGPWYIYFPVLLVGFAPWSLYLPLAVAETRFWQRRYWQKIPRSTHLGLFLTIWLVIVFLFFSVAVTKRPNYILPLIPATAMLVGMMWSSYLTNPQPQKNDPGLVLSGLVNVAALSGLAIALYHLTSLIGSDPLTPDLIPALERSNLAIQGSIIWAVTALIAAIMIVMRKSPWLWLPNLIGFLTLLIVVMMPASFLIDRVRQQPLRELSALAVQVRQPKEQLVMLGFEKPSVVYYTKQPVKFIQNNETIEQYIESQKQSWLLISPEDKLRQLGLSTNISESIGKSGAYQLLRVKKSG
ncbi:ArnT family glycosyltransferase [Merismopedia glauca]|uniref:Glycosyltransferase n=1 Tax=Merismopedia glauca CCAP 1448/3 TaxID=1296344 RepID=A0A2T1C991_9CYAN|nr:glycosyltransferase family 39 protein [Merismopedia glauca]PSB04811.1 glycosyltransferase [Merismopedia glauca CCAP 1448/3]